MPLDRDDCPYCGKAGMVGREREVIGSRAVTVFKCHHCNRTWRIPDSPAGEERQVPRTTPAKSRRPSSR
jgi:transposase-like protein